MARTHTAVSFRWGGTSISACRRAILKVYKILEILEIKVMEIKPKAVKIKGLKLRGLTIKVRKHWGRTGAQEDISAPAPPEARRKSRRRPRARLKPGR